MKIKLKCNVAVTSTDKELPHIPGALKTKLPMLFVIFASPLSTPPSPTHTRKSEDEEKLTKELEKERKYNTELSGAGTEVFTNSVLLLL